MSIFVFGPSCGGKSTLCKALHKELGWTHVDRDNFEEKDPDAAMEKTIAKLDHAIIDVQIPWRDKAKGEIFILLMPPLEVLLARDANRTERLGRTEMRANWARDYVITTHKTLSEMDASKFDCIIDSSVLSTKEIAEKVLKLTK